MNRTAPAVAIAIGMALFCYGAESSYKAKSISAQKWKLETTLMDIPEIEQLERVQASRIHSHGPAVLRVSLRGNLVYSATYKEASSESKFPIASSSKWLVAATIMTLSEEGLLSLDDSVVAYIPSFTGEKAAITIRQLLGHTSGLPPLKSRSLNHPQDLARFSRQVAGASLEYPPGTKFCYGTTSYHIARYVAEVATGEDWEEIFQSRVARRVGMSRASFQVSGNNSFKGPVASPTGFMRFLEAFRTGKLRDGSVFLSRGSIGEMTSSYTNGMTLGGASRIRRPGHSGDQYGLGLWIERTDPSTHLPDLISHHGSSGFKAIIDNRNEVSVVFATRGKKGKRRLLRRKFDSVLSLVGTILKQHD